ADIDPGCRQIVLKPGHVRVFAAELLRNGQTSLEDSYRSRDVRRVVAEMLKALRSPVIPGQLLREPATAVLAEDLLRDLQALGQSRDRVIRGAHGKIDHRQAEVGGAQFSLQPQVASLPSGELLCLLQ